MTNDRNDDAAPTTIAPAEDAEPMRLRAPLPTVTRLSRKMLAGLGVVAAVGLGGSLIYALQTREPAIRGEDLYSTDNRPTADGLAALPRDYSGPVLGPPLPGDLGRPILNAQNRGQPAGPPPTTQPATPADTARQRRLAEDEAARTSRVFFQTEANPAAASAIPGPLTGAGLAMPAMPLGGTMPTAQERQSTFLAATADRRTLASDRIVPPASPFVLQAGAVIPAALITGIRADLPGQITAQVTENVYDSPTGQILLVPQGTRVVGEYSNDVGYGQRRVLLVWNRLIFPNGRSIVLERQPGADRGGYAGLEDRVDHHWWGIAKAAGLSTLLAVGAELAVDDDDRLLRAIRTGSQDTINQAGQQIIQRQLQVAPTLTIRAGFPLRVIVTRDLILEPYGAAP